MRDFVGCMFAFAVLAAASAAGLGQAYPAPATAPPVSPPQSAICPWLATGTAARVLGGEVAVAAKVENPQSGSCRFVLTSGGTAASIEVLAGAATTHACPVGSMKLAAIGNEAVQCRVAAQHADVVAGRIRDIYFVLTVTGVAGIADVGPPDSHLADAHPTSPLERLAEQVVGNLY